MSPSFAFDFDDLVRRAVQDPAQPTQRDHRDVPALFQRIQRPVVDAALEQQFLSHALQGKKYFIDTLFDLINESDALEVELQDIRADYEGFTITMKDGTVFKMKLT